MSANDFITLEEFLLLKNNSKINIHKNEHLDSGGFYLTHGEDLLIRYKMAKKSYESFGYDGPPINTVVYTLYDNNGVCAVRKFEGIYNNMYFAISRPNTYKETYENLSLVYRKYWWAQISLDNPYDVVKYWVKNNK